MNRSETIELTAAAGVPLAVRDVVRMMQGFYFIFWGLLLAVLAGVQTLGMMWWPTLTDKLVAVGVAATVIGVWRLRQVRLDDSPAAQVWRVRAGRVFGAALLLVYFTVIFYLWRAAPMNLYLQANMVAFAATGMLFLALLNPLVAALAAVLGREQLCIESSLYLGANVILLVLPMVGGLTFSGWLAQRHDSNLLVEFHGLLAKMNLMTSIVVLLPVSLTLSLVWAAKDTLLRALTENEEPTA